MILGNGEARGGALEAHRDQYQTIDFSMWLPSQTSKVVVFTPHISYRNWLYFFPVACSCRNQLLLRNWKPCRTWTELAPGLTILITCPIAPGPVLALAVTRRAAASIGSDWRTSQDCLFLSSSHLLLSLITTLLDSHHMDTRYPSRPF